MSTIYHQSLRGSQLHPPFSFGLESLLPASPSVGDWYFATDTNILRKCASAGVWSNDWTFEDIVCDSINCSGEGAFASLDVSGSVDIDGTLETDAITLNGAAINAANGIVTQSAGGIVQGKRMSGYVVRSVGSVYLADTDGEVTFRCGGNCVYAGYIGVANPPDVLFAAEGGNTVAANISFSFFVPKGYYWSVALDSGGPGAPVLRWTPSGT